jgi:hypothetical protein
MGVMVRRMTDWIENRGVISECLMDLEKRNN